MANHRREQAVEQQRFQPGLPQGQILIAQKMVHAAVQLVRKAAFANDTPAPLEVVHKAVRKDGHRARALEQAVHQRNILKVFSNRKTKALKQFPPEELVPDKVLKRRIRDERGKRLSRPQRPRRSRRRDGEAPSILKRHKKAANGQGRAIPPLRQKQGFVKAGFRRIVAVEKAQILPRGRSDACVSRRGQAAVLLMDHAEAAVPGRVGIQNLSRTVGRAVVHGDDLKPRMGLSKQAVEAGREIGRHPVHRHDHGNQGHIVHAQPSPAALAASTRRAGSPA